MIKLVTELELITRRIHTKSQPFVALCFAFTLMLLGHSINAATYTWNGANLLNPGAWNDPINWGQLINYPNAAGDIVIINAGAFSNPVLDINRTLAGLTINNGGILDLGGKTLTLAGNITTAANSQLNNGRLSATGTTANIQGLTATARLSLSYSSFSNILNNTFQDTILLNKTGTAHNTNNNGNAFNGYASITHNGGAGNFQFSTTAANSFANLTLQSNSTTGAFDFSYAAASTYTGNILINTSTHGITFGAGGGSSTLSATKSINTGTYLGGNSSIQNFIQNGSASSSLSLTSGSLSITNATMGGNVTVMAATSQSCTFSNSIFSLAFSVTSGGVSVNNCTFNQNGGTTLITTTGSTIDSPTNGGNTFYGATTIRNNTGSSSLLYFANPIGDTYYNTASFDNGGISPLSPVRNGTSNFYGTITVLNTTSGNPIVFGDGTGITQIMGTAATSLISSNTSTGAIFDELILNKPSGFIQLSNASITINNNFSLTNGYLDLNNLRLIINNPAASTLNRTNGYILSGNTNQNSAIQWNIGNSVGTRIFPFGKSDGTYVPFTSTLTSGTVGNLSAYTYSTAPDNTPYASPVNNMYSAVYNGDASIEHAVDRFWKIYKTGPDGISTQTFTYADNEIPLSGEGNLFAQVWTTEWITGVGSGTPASNSVTASGITDYSHWTLVNSDYFLPANLLSFDYKHDNNQNILYWKISSEEQLSQFNVERSSDGIHFHLLQTIPYENAQTYSAIDAAPYTDATYYRLALIGKESDIAYSSILKINSSSCFSVYPNPSSGNELFVHWETEKNNTLIVLQDVMGRIIYEKLYIDTNVNGDINLFDGFSKIEAGIYFVIASSQNELIKKKIIVK